MKKELYSCLKMLESFNQTCIHVAHSKEPYSAGKLAKQYSNIRDLIIKVIEQDKVNFIPPVYIPLLSDNPRGFISLSRHISLIQELISASNISISYLKSLDMDLNKEMEEKKKELELKEKELEYTKKLVQKSLDAIERFPELTRSKIVEETKKSHREIEKSSRP